jgi:hypothetical protein
VYVALAASIAAICGFSGLSHLDYKRNWGLNWNQRIGETSKASMGARPDPSQTAAVRMPRKPYTNGSVKIGRPHYRR